MQKKFSVPGYLFSGSAMEAVLNRANEVGKRGLFQVPLEGFARRNEDSANRCLYTMAYRTVLIRLFWGQNERFCVFNSPENLG